MQIHKNMQWFIKNHWILFLTWSKIWWKCDKNKKNQKCYIIAVLIMVSSLLQGSTKTLTLFRSKVHLQTKIKKMRKHQSTWSIKMFHQRSELTRWGSALYTSPHPWFVVFFFNTNTVYYFVYFSSSLVCYRVGECYCCFENGCCTVV